MNNFFLLKYKQIFSFHFQQYKLTTHFIWVLCIHLWGKLCAFEHWKKVISFTLAGSCNFLFIKCICFHKNWLFKLGVNAVTIMLFRVRVLLFLDENRLIFIKHLSFQSEFFAVWNPAKLDILSLFYKLKLGRD